MPECWNITAIAHDKHTTVHTVIECDSMILRFVLNIIRFATLTEVSVSV